MTACGVGKFVRRDTFADNPFRPAAAWRSGPAESRPRDTSRHGFRAHKCAANRTVFSRSIAARLPSMAASIEGDARKRELADHAAGLQFKDVARWWQDEAGRCAPLCCVDGGWSRAA